MILDQLLGSVSRRLFLEEHYLKLPFSLAGGCASLAPLGEWSAIGAILAADGADVIVGAGGQQYGGKTPATIDEAKEALAAGYTLGIRHAERHDGALAKLASEFQEEFAAPIDIHLYCTPASHRGFGWHYDAEEVFILQLRGVKEWSLRKNTVNPWPLVETLPADMRYEREIMPLLRCTLAAGDWLYIPTGYWHKTEAGSAESVSLSVGIGAASAMEVYDFLRSRLLDSLRWRQRLTCLGTAATKSDEELKQELLSVFQDLGADLARLLGDETLVSDFLAAKRAFAQSAASVSNE